VPIVPPELPELPELLELVELPELPELPELVELPELPEEELMPLELPVASELVPPSSVAVIVTWPPHAAGRAAPIEVAISVDSNRAWLRTPSNHVPSDPCGQLAHAFRGSYREAATIGEAAPTSTTSAR
jgi:hypothetical protein